MKTLAIGGHFICNNVLPKMVEVRSNLNIDDGHTNADHHSLEQVLRRMLLKAIRVDRPQDCKFSSICSETINANCHLGKIENIIPLLMMVLQPRAYVPFSVKQSSLSYNSLSETKNEVAVCKKVATSIAMVILMDHSAVNMGTGQIHKELKDMLGMEDLGYLTEAHFARAKELLGSI